MTTPRRYRNLADLPAVIPIFPLTGVLLLPHTRLPLNVFEPRYLAMVDHAMASYRMIGMIQPRTPGEDMAPRPALADVGCAGRIVEYGETDDGRYLVTLAGIIRFKIAGERDGSEPYREIAADYAAFAEDLRQDTEPDFSRERLLEALKPYLVERGLNTDWETLEQAPAEMLVNALAMICPFDPEEKQALLEAATVKERAEALLALIEIANASSGAGGKPSIN
jgi:Lon protease-like protein